MANPKIDDLSKFMANTRHPFMTDPLYPAQKSSAARSTKGEIDHGRFRNGQSVFDAPSKHK
jgi:hypothetical protein